MHRRPAVIERPAPARERPRAAFDLYFVAYPADGDWSGVMQALERSPWRTKPFGERDHVLWERMVSRVERLLPRADIRSSPAIHELTHVESGIQFSYVPGGIILSVPYWYRGEEALRLVGLLRRIVAAVEAETGLTAYDPQAEAPFLAYGASSAAATIEQRSPALADAEAARAPKLPKPKSWRHRRH